MAKYLPAEQGIVDVIEDRLVALLTQKLKTEVDADDTARVDLVHVGPREFAPAAVIVLIYENDLANAESWKHQPEVHRRRAFSGEGGSQEYVGGGFLYQRAFTAEIQVWGREVELEVVPRDIGHIVNVVAGRVYQALKDGGETIGTLNLVEDDFTEAVYAGPFFHDEWAVRQEGQALNSQKKIQFYYRTQRGF